MQKNRGDGRDEDEWILSEGLAKGLQYSSCLRTRNLLELNLRQGSTDSEHFGGW